MSFLFLLKVTGDHPVHLDGEFLLSLSYYVSLFSLVSLSFVINCLGDIGIPGSYTWQKDSPTTPTMMMLGEQSAVDRCIQRVGERNDHRKMEERQDAHPGRWCNQALCIFYISQLFLRSQIDKQATNIQSSSTPTASSFSLSQSHILGNRYLITTFLSRECSGGTKGEREIERKVW